MDRNQSPCTIYGIKHKDMIVYVGSTQKNPAQRFGKHLCAARNGSKGLLYDFIRKKKPSLSLVVLEVCLPESRYERETFYIKNYKTAEIGYNEDSSAVHGRPKGCFNPSGKDHYLYGKKLPEHVRQIVIAANLGRKQSEETKNKKRESLLSGERKDRKPVVGDNGVHYRGLSEAARSIGVATINLRKQIRKNRPCKGVVYSFAED